MHRILFFCILAIFISSCKNKPSSNQSLDSEDLAQIMTPPYKDSFTFYSIKKFVDGDTFWIDNGTEKGEKIRLIGIDTPESRNMFDIKKEPYGKEASDYVKQLLKGKKVRLEYDVDKYDRYGRTLAYIYLEDGTFLNAHLIEAGFAQIYTVPPNVKYADQFLALQKEARNQEKGLWKFQDQ